MAETNEHTAIKTTSIIRTELKNSYEFGKAGNRHKVYYGTAEQLKKLIDELTNMGFTDAIC